MPYKDPARQRAYNKVYARQHYEANKPAYKARARAHTARQEVMLQAWVTEYLRSHPCLDCGENDIIVLEFDHRDPATKSFAVAELLSRHPSLARLKAEVEKCDVRCANCHRRKTYAERGSRHRS